MAPNTLKCNHLMLLRFKGLKLIFKVIFCNLLIRFVA